MRSNDRDMEYGSLSEVSAKLGYYLEKVNKTKRPLVITRDGENSAILIDSSEYFALIERAEFSEDLKIAETQIESGNVISHKELKERLSLRG